jgi:nitrate reductase NapE component
MGLYVIDFRCNINIVRTLLGDYTRHWPVLGTVLRSYCVLLAWQFCALGSVSDRLTCMPHSYTYRNSCWTADGHLIALISCLPETLLYAIIAFALFPLFACWIPLDTCNWLTDWDPLTYADVWTTDTCAACVGNYCVWFRQVVGEPNVPGHWGCRRCFGTFDCSWYFDTLCLLAWLPLYCCPMSACVMSVNLELTKLCLFVSCWHFSGTKINTVDDSASRPWGL